MIAPAMAPATPPITAPFLVLSRSVATSANAAVDIRAINVAAISFFMVSSDFPCPGDPLSQRFCHCANNYSFWNEGACCLPGAGVTMGKMAAPPQLLHEIRKLLKYGDLPFRDFVELALYHPQLGYYTQEKVRVGKEGDYVTAPLLSPVFSFTIAGLFREFLSRAEGAVCSFVDIGCGDGSLVAAVASQSDDRSAHFYGVD